MQLTHVRLLVGDYVRCFSFYRDVLGLEVTFGDPASGYADLRAGDGSTLALFDRSEQEGVVELRPPGDGSLLVFGVDDVDAFCRQHEDFMIGPPHDRDDWRIRVAYLRDPDGNLIEVNQPLPTAK
jgi:catechol 2,3-dioxygenase-like lactoylglutathione lyase family enzyme